jgi:aspartyl protease family protein
VIGRGFAVLVALASAATALEAFSGGLRVETADPVMLTVALLILFVIIATALPARRGDYAGIPVRRAGWAVLAVGDLLAYSQSDAKQEIANRVLRAPTPTIAVASTPGEVELQRTYDGHFRARAQIGDAGIGMMLDTGASIVLLRYDDAARIGLDMDRLIFSTPVTTANGRAMVAPVTLETIRIGGVLVENVRAAVAQSGNLHTSLLGMSFLGELEEVSIRRDRMILRN